MRAKRQAQLLHNLEWSFFYFISKVSGAHVVVVVVVVVIVGFVLVFFFKEKSEPVMLLVTSFVGGSLYLFSFSSFSP